MSTTLSGEPLLGPIFYGPCPGCDKWGLEAPASTPWQVIAVALQEHADECPRLVEVLHAKTEL